MRRFHIDTPMLAGDDRGRLWFAALTPLADLVEAVSGGRPGGPFMDFLYATPFTEVYTDRGSRVHGHPGCCVVDLFTYAFYPAEHALISMKVARSIAAEWGGVEGGAHYEARLKVFRSRTPESFIPEHMPVIQLIRFRMDEEGANLGEGRSWATHSARLLHYVLSTLYARTLDPDNRHSYRFPIHAGYGTFTDEGHVPYRDVARYFYDLPRRSYSGTLGDAVPGGYAEGRDPSEFDPRELRRGTRVEMEHTRDPRIAQEIAMDHLTEDPHYYIKLKRAGL